MDSSSAHQSRSVDGSPLRRPRWLAIRPTPLRMAWCAWQSRSLEIRNWSQFADDMLPARPSIAVVGNAGYLLDAQQGDFIDRHDLVLRMNNFRLHGFERQVGRRVDVFLTNFYTDIDFANPAIRSARHIVSSVPANLAKSRKDRILNRHREHILAGMQMMGRTTVFAPSWAPFVALVQQFGAYPTTGAMAILFVLDLLARTGGKAYVTGFSFFSGRSHYFSQQTADTRNHGPAAERQILRELLARPLESGQVMLDAHMKHCLHAEKAA